MSYAPNRGEISGVLASGLPELRPSGRPATLYVSTLNEPLVAAVAGVAPVPARPVTASAATARVPRSLLMGGSGRKVGQKMNDAQVRRQPVWRARAVGETVRVMRVDSHTL
jgi:hypothetical protein